MRRNRSSLPLALSLLLLPAFAWFFRFTAFLNFSLDLLASLEPPPPAANKSAVIILGVDLAALRAYELAPGKGQAESEARLVDRKMFVIALERLKKLGTSAIGLDFLFQVPRDATTDKKLAEAIRACGNVVVTGSWVNTTDKPAWMPPLPDIARVARAVAAANCPPDDDGVIRRMPVASTDKQPEPFPLALAKVALHTEYVSQEGNRFRLNNARPFPNQDITVDADGAMIIRPLRGPEGNAFVVVPIVHFLEMPEDKLPTEVFKDKVVLIGTTDPLFNDFHKSPLTRFSHAQMPGVEILGTAVHDILENRFLTPVTLPWLAAGLVFPVMLTAFLSFRLNFPLAIVVVAFEAIGLLAASYALYEQGLLVSVVDLAVPVFGAGVIGAWWRTMAQPVASAPVVQAKPAVEVSATETTMKTSGSVARAGQAAAESVEAASRVTGKLPVRAGTFSTAFLEKYEISKTLGEGAFGLVVLAKNKFLQKEVAIKTLKEMNDEDVARFVREAQILASLDHPNILRVLDAGIDNQTTPYIVMELVDGTTLHDLPQRPDLRRSLEIIASVADALAYAHDRGVIHRDVKPANVFVMTQGQVKLADFGLARGFASGQTKLTQTGLIMGTPLYISPEAAMGDTVGPATDQYALGVMAYELIAGQPPFDGDNPMAVITARLTQDAPKLSTRCHVSASVEELVMRTLARNPADRFSSVAELAAKARAAVASL